MPSVPLALLADHAVANTEDRKLYVLGGGLRSMSFFGFPASMPHLALALGLEFAADELRAEPHTLRVAASGPGPEPIVKPLAASFTVPRDPLQPDRSIYFHFVYDMESITFPAEGLYVFSVIIDDELVTEVPLRVLTTPGPAPADLQPQLRLAEGYNAYAEGDLQAAMDIFRDVTVRFPTVAAGHNNLGFLLLGQGRAQAALDSFTKARELGFQAELLDANIACAHYLLGDHVSASIFFQQCLRIYGFRAQSILFGIEHSRLFPVTLNSASDYVALMMLDAGWSALASGDRSAAMRYLEGAQAADLGRREDEGGKNFAQSTEALREKLS